jgi:ferrous iron transport protein B
MTITVALAGNPNTGKSSLFNALTGSRQHVGNWPGKTVARHEGCFEHGGTTCRVVDLPGTYSLSATSPEEIIARDYLLSHEPDLVVLVLDASNLERNLYLAVQVLEMGVPSVIALNMTDVAHTRGDRIDVDMLGHRLGTTVVPTVARTGSGVERLRDAIARVVAGIGAS